MGSNGVGALSAELAVLRSALGRPRNRQEQEARKHTDGPTGTDNPGYAHCPYSLLRSASGCLDFPAADGPAGVRNETELAADVSRWSLQEGCDLGRGVLARRG